MAGLGGAPRRALVLIGFMGAGKSTVAAELSEALGVAAVDSDELLEERLGHPPARAFELEGEPAFRAAEEELVCMLLNDAGPGSVIALGGGSVCSERVRRALEPHLTVLLDVDPALAWARIQAQEGAGERPLARDWEAFRALHSSRAAVYEELADAVLPAMARGTSGRVLEALRALAAAPPGARLLWASSESGGYPVLIGPGMLRDAAQLRELWPLDRSVSQPFCVSDETVAALYAERLGEVRGMLAIAPGEEQKTLRAPKPCGARCSPPA